MNRRSLFKVFGALTASFFLPPIKAASARVRRLVETTWSEGTRHWEHLVRPEPVAMPDNAVAYRVCRMLNPAKAPPTNVSHWEGYRDAVLRTAVVPSWRYPEKEPTEEPRRVNSGGDPYVAHARAETQPYSGPKTESRTKRPVVYIDLKGLFGRRRDKAS